MKQKILYVLCGVLLANSSMACTRLTYVGEEQLVVVGRTLDWMEDMRSEIIAYPAGIARAGDDGAHSVTWMSKYSSIVTTAYNLGAVDGMNSQGLDVNILYLSSADFGAVDPKYKNLSVFNWAQYMLDNYATVEEAVHDFQLNNFNIIAPILPNGSPSSVHLSMTDPSGDNAILEYIKGKLTIHHGAQYQVMTNDPIYSQQLALNNYWQNLNGSFLPGTDLPADRFVRASYYLKNAPQTKSQQIAVAIVASIVRNVSSPFSIKNSHHANIAPTRWRTYADLKNKVYFYEATDRPNIFWIDFAKLKLDLGSQAKKLPLTHNEIYEGEQSKSFVDLKP